MEAETGSQPRDDVQPFPAVPPVPRPPDEDARIASLLSLQILDTPFEERFDRLTRLARRLFDVPIVLVTLIDVNRQWFKSCVGLDIRETPRDLSFCTYAILDDGPLVIEDARRDPRFAHNPFVATEPGVRAYAGIPLRSPGGYKLGTLCVVDRQPRCFSPDDLELLGDLARIVENELGAVELNVALADQRRMAEENARLYQAAQTELAERRRAEAERAQALASLQRAVAEAERQSAAKSHVVSIVSHEFRTALTSVLGFSELLKEGHLSLDEVRQFGEALGETAQRLNRLITDLLDLDRIESGRFTLQRTTIALNAVVRRSVEEMRSALTQHAPRLDLDPSDPLVSGDEDRLIQVMTNLLANAAKYSPGGGPIEIATRRVAGAVRLSVRDHGIGIAAPDLERIFERYMRTDSGPSSAIRGTGLGLPIVREIVGLHGGRVWAESTLGVGSTFHVELPVSDP